MSFVLKTKSVLYEIVGMSEDIETNDSPVTSKKSIKIKCKKKKRFFPALESLESLESPKPKEESDHLLKENEELKTCCKNQEADIKCLRKHVQELNDIINAEHLDVVGRGSNVFSSKITELSKRNRALCSELEVHKDKCTSFEKELASLKDELAKKNAEPEVPVTIPANPSEVEQVKTELNQVKCKLFEAMNQNSSLRNEVRYMQKCVQQEIGAENLHSAAGWKGRSQQIIKLQARVNELTKQLEGDVCTKTLQVNMETSRKQEVEKIKQECAELKEIVSSQKQKIAALKVRNHNLADEVALTKFKLDETVRKCKEADAYVETLNVRIYHQN